MRADRLLSILLLLQANGRMTAQVLARRLEVSERTILRDMDALSGAGVPVTAERGVGGGWRLLDGYQTKLTGLTSPEIQSLFLGRPPKLMADLGLQDASEAAWIKLQASLPIEVRGQAEFVRQRILIDARGWRDSAEAISSLPVLLEALCAGGACGSTTSAPRTARASASSIRSVSSRAATTGISSRTKASSGERTASRGLAGLRCSRRRQTARGLRSRGAWERAATEFREQLPRYHATFLADAAVMPWVRYRGRRIEQETPEGDRVRVRVRFDV